MDIYKGNNYKKLIPFQFYYFYLFGIFCRLFYVFKFKREHNLPFLTQRIPSYGILLELLIQRKCKLGKTLTA